MKKLKNMNWMSILGLSLIVLGTILSFFGSYFSDEKGQKELTHKIEEKNETIDEIKKTNTQLLEQNSSLIKSSEESSKSNKDLISQNTGLVKSNSEISNSNKSLASQNADMLSKISNYQTDLEERNKTIRQLEREVSNVKEYSNYAKMDMYGLEMSGSSGITVTTALSQKMDQILLKNGDKVSVRKDLKILPLIENVIEENPNFPFGYFAKAILLKELNQKNWKDAAMKAIEILKVTTSISGHHLVHDRVLKILNDQIH